MHSASNHYTNLQAKWRDESKTYFFFFTEDGLSQKAFKFILCFIF